MSKQPRRMQYMTKSNDETASRKEQFLDAVQGSALRGQRALPTRDFGRLFTGLLFGLFMVTLLIAIMTGTRVYSSLVDMQLSDNDERLATSLIANYVHAADAVDAIGEGEGPEGRSLVLTERLDSGTFENRLYLSNGKLVEEYAVQGMSYSPGYATPIVSTEVFDFVFNQGVLTITTDYGDVNITLRTAQGGM